MLYVARTNIVRNIVQAHSNLCENIRRTFKAHFENSGEARQIGSGSTRIAYEIGRCEIAEGRLSLILKLFRKDEFINGFDFATVCPRGHLTFVREELGAFEVYYDFIAGTLDSLSFCSDENYAEYVERMLNYPTMIAPRVIDLTGEWNGTHVERGDLGAVPYFQMVVRYKKYFGILTEGEPSLIEPKYTAEAFLDYNTVENGRIIDLSASQCSLSEINHDRLFNDADDLGLTARGNKYFGRHNLLNL